MASSEAATAAGSTTRWESASASHAAPDPTVRSSSRSGRHSACHGAGGALVLVPGGRGEHGGDEARDRDGRGPRGTAPTGLRLCGSVEEPPRPGTSSRTSPTSVWASSTRSVATDPTAAPARPSTPASSATRPRSVCQGEHRLVEAQPAGERGPHREAVPPKAASVPTAPPSWAAGRQASAARRRPRRARSPSPRPAARRSRARPAAAGCARRRGVSRWSRARSAAASAAPPQVGGDHLERPPGHQHRRGVHDVLAGRAAVHRARRPRRAPRRGRPPAARRPAGPPGCPAAAASAATAADVEPLRRQAPAMAAARRGVEDPGVGATRGRAPPRPRAGPAASPRRRRRRGRRRGRGPRRRARARHAAIMRARRGGRAGAPSQRSRATLGELLDDRRAERVEVVRVAAGDQALVDDDLLVDDRAARVADVGAQARERGERAGPRTRSASTRVHGRVADRADRLAGRGRSPARTR